MPPPNIRTPGTVYVLNYTTLQLVLYGGVILFQDLWMFKLRAQSCYTVLKIIWQQPMLLLLRNMPSSKLKLFSKASRTVSLSRMPTESISQNLSKSPCSVSSTNFDPVLTTRESTKTEYLKVSPSGDFPTDSTTPIRLCWKEGEEEEVDVVGRHIFFEIALIRSVLGFYNHFYVFSFIRIYLSIF